jgi:hypothetical protein
MSLLRGQQEWRVLVVSAEENKVLVFCILDHFITGEKPETAGE